MKSAAAFVIGISLLMACSVAVTNETGTTKLAATAPVDRAVTISTTACGHASKTSGAGVIIGDERVLAAAHVVIGAGTVSVTPVLGEQEPLRATVVRLDPRTDLAILAVPGLAADPIELADADVGGVLQVSGGGPSGSFEATITRAVDVRIEEVRSTVRSSRRGYELDHRVALGDSGAGAFNDRNELVAIIYGRTQSDDGLTFAVRKTEIEALLDAPDQSWSCDTTQSRIVAE